VKEQARARFSQPVHAVDALLGQALKGEPEHALARLFADQSQATAPLEMEDTETAKLANPETGCEWITGAEQDAAVVPQV